MLTNICMCLFVFCLSWAVCLVMMFCSHFYDDVVSAPHSVTRGPLCRLLQWNWRLYSVCMCTGMLLTNDGTLILWWKCWQQWDRIFFMTSCILALTFCLVSSYCLDFIGWEACKHLLCLNNKVKCKCSMDVVSLWILLDLRPVAHH